MTSSSVLITVLLLTLHCKARFVRIMIHAYTLLIYLSACIVLLVMPLSAYVKYLMSTLNYGVNVLTHINMRLVSPSSEGDVIIPTFKRCWKSVSTCDAF